MASDISAPAAPPGDAPAAEISVAVGDRQDEQRLLRSTLRVDWRHTFWGIPLGLLLVAGDALLVPGEDGLTVGGKLLFCVALALVATATAWTWGAPARPWWFAAAAVAGIVAAAASGDWFGPQAPPWRDAVVPAVDVALLGVALGAWYARRRGAELLLVAGVTATGLVFYGQQTPPLWALIGGVAGTLLFLVPSVGAFARNTGLVVHALALLALLQQQESWFAWTPFPFLSLIPVYLVLTWLREVDGPRRVAWWTGTVVGGGSLLLGLSTLVGGLRKDLPLGESWVMLGIGFGVLALFLLLRMGPWAGARVPEAA